MTMSDEVDLVRGLQLVADVLAAGPLTATSQLSDGTTGWHMRRTDDCWQAALATLLQVPLDDVPDGRLDQRVASGESVERVDETAWAEMLAWLTGRGLGLVEHETSPVHLDRWIGIIPVSRPFQSHSLVMSGSRILFDPAVKPGVRTFYEIEVEYGYSIGKV